MLSLYIVSHVFWACLPVNLLQYLHFRNLISSNNAIVLAIDGEYVYVYVCTMLVGKPVPFHHNNEIQIVLQLLNGSPFLYQLCKEI